MKKNSTKVFFTIVSVAIIVSIIASVLIYNGKLNDARDQASQAQSSILAEKQTEKTTDHTVPTVIETVTVDPNPATEQDISAQVDFLVKGEWWYYFDIQARECYAFKFDEDMNMQVAFFNSDNIDGEDAQYFTGTSTYTIVGNNIELRYLPDALTKKSFDLTIKGNKLFNVDDKMAQHDDLSLDYPVGYFMVLDKVQ